MPFTHFIHSHQTLKEKGDGEGNHSWFTKGERSPPLPFIVFSASTTKDMHLAVKSLFFFLFFYCFDFISFMRNFVFFDSIAFWVLIQLCCYKIWILLCFLFWLCQGRLQDFCPEGLIRNINYIKSKTKENWIYLYHEKKNEIL